MKGLGNTHVQPKGKDVEPTVRGTDFLAGRVSYPVVCSPLAHSPLVSNASEKRITALRNTSSVHMLAKPCKNV
jgi:hypothetical protein